MRPKQDFARPVRKLVVLVVGLLVVQGSGCGRQAGTVNEAEEGMKKASALYMHYVRNHRGQGPKDEADFRKHLDSIPKDELEKMQITDIDKALTSPRDGQKYVIVFGSNMTTPTPQNQKGGAGYAEKGKSAPPPNAKMTGPSIIMYEKEGKGGRRYAAYAQGGSVVELDDESFKRLVPGAQ